MGKLNWGSLLIGAVVGVVIYMFLARRRTTA